MEASVAPPFALNQLDLFVEVAHRQTHADPQAQLAPLGERAIGAVGREVFHAGDAAQTGGVGDCQRVANRRLGLGRGGRRHDPVHQVHRQLAQNAGRLARAVAKDLPAGGVRRVAADSRLLQRLAAHPEAVAIAPGQGDRMAGGRRVE